MFFYGNCTIYVSSGSVLTKKKFLFLVVLVFEVKTSLGKHVSP
jgi:hypothetical protein